MSRRGTGNLNRVLRASATGAVSGLAAAFVMNCFQIALGKLSERLSPEPEDNSSDRNSAEPSTVRAVEKFQGIISGRPLPEGQRQTAGNVHYAFGALLGLTYALASRRFPQIRSRYGTVFGGAVSLVVDETLLPAADLSPKPGEVPLTSHFYGIASHLVFGAALEAALRREDAALARSG